jgi:hypothetical protein
MRRVSLITIGCLCAAYVVWVAARGRAPVPNDFDLQVDCEVQVLDDVAGRPIEGATLVTADSLRCTASPGWRGTIRQEALEAHGDPPASA